MTSQINPNNIDGTYPVAGQDNDSQGFRDNFTNIRNNFTFTKAELEDLQNKVVLKSALLNTTLSNDFAGNAMVGPALTSWRETYNNIGSVSGSVTINFVNGNFQRITMSGSTSLTFSFPSNTNNQYASIKLWVNNTNSSWTLTLPAAVTLNGPLSVGGAAGSPPVITFTSSEISNNNNYFFEFFTVDGGTTIGIIDHTRNRDIALTALNVSGTFTANGNVLLGSGTASNVVVTATTTSTSSTTGALVVSGGLGITGNVNVATDLRVTANSFVDGNLWVNSGNIRSSSSLANIFNVTATTISVGNAATNIFMGLSSGNVVAAGNILVGGNAYIVGNTGTVGNTITSGGRINNNYLLANVVTGQNLRANVNYNRFIANASPTGTVANLFITLPNSVEDGRELEFVTTTPITSCFISNMTPGVTSVYGLANTWASSASLTNAVMVRLMYNTTVGRWFKVN